MMAYTIRDKECWIVGFEVNNCVRVSVRGCIIVGMVLALLSYNRSIFIDWGVHVNLKWREVVGSKETAKPAPNQTRLHRITRACTEALFYIRSVDFTYVLCVLLDCKQCLPRISRGCSSRKQICIQSLSQTARYHHRVVFGVPLVNLVPQNSRLGWLMWVVTSLPRIDGGINVRREVSLLHGLSTEPGPFQGAPLL